MRCESRHFGSATLLAALILMTGGPVLAAGQPGDAGFLSLRFGVGARETAMGEAGVASTGGGAAIYWNPARLALEQSGLDLLLQHQRLYGLFSKETASLADRIGGGVLGVYFSGFYSDEITRYSDEQVGVPLGTFKPSDVVFGLAYARQIVKDVAAGAAVKYLHQSIDVYSANGYAVDLFLAHRARIPGLYFGASLTNLGPRMNFRDAPFNLPTTLRLGAAYDPAHHFFAGRVTFAGDVVFPNDGNAKAHVGAEYRLVPEVALRVGTRINYESQGLTAGIGLRKGRLEVGYAFEDNRNDLDAWHKFTLDLHY